jgi:hypothetical protein
LTAATSPAAKSSKHEIARKRFLDPCLGVMPKIDINNALFSTRHVNLDSAPRDPFGPPPSSSRPAHDHGEISGRGFRGAFPNRWLRAWMQDQKLFGEVMVYTLLASAFYRPQ